MKKVSKPVKVKFYTKTDKKIEPRPPIEPTPEFEETLKTIAGGPQEQGGGEPQKDGRGGARPGAGRPKGVTEDFAAVNRLPEKPNLTLIPVLRAPFEFWAQSQGLPELALTKDEATNLALPVTQLLEFYFPGKIPEIAWCWLMMFGSTFNILEPRLKLLAKKRNEKTHNLSPNSPAEQGGGPASDMRAGVRPSVQPSQAGRAAQPAKGYPKDGRK